MSDYARQQNFNSKSGTTIFGSDVDSEFDALVTAVNSKIDESREGVALGIATLDGTVLVPAGVSGDPDLGGGQLPEASTTALGAVELATAAEAQALTDALRAITPDSLDDVLTANGGLAKDIQQLAAPGSDTVLGYDLTGTAVVNFTLGAGLATTGTVLNLADAVAGNGLAIASSVLSVGAGNGLTSSADAIDVVGGSGITANANDIALTDAAATTTNPVDISTGVVSLDIEALTTIEGNALAATGTVYVEDGGVSKGIEVQEMGLRVQTAQATQTLAASDMNSIMEFTGTATLTLPLNATTALPIGTPIVLNMKHASQVLTVTAAASVTLVTVHHPAGAAAASDTVSAGGTAILYKTAADTWALSGDIAD